MHFHHREGLETVAALGIPDAVVLVSGEAAVARGLRPRHPEGDFDIVTTLQGNLYLEEKLGFQAVRQVIMTGPERSITARIGGPKNKIESHRWAFSRARYLAMGKGRIYIDELLELSDQDDETSIYVLNKAGLLLQKDKTGRPKDEEDVRLIREQDD